MTCEQFLGFSSGYTFTLHGTFNLVLHITQYKETDQVRILPQNRLCTSSHNNKRLTLVSFLSQKIKLQISNVFLWRITVAFYRSREKWNLRQLIEFFQCLNIHFLVQCNLAEHMIIIKSQSKSFCQLLCYPMSTASILTSNGNNQLFLQFHTITFLSINNI